MIIEILILWFTEFQDVFPDFEPTDSFEEVMFALRGNRETLPASDETVVGGGKIPGCTSYIQFDTSIGILEISWHSASSGKQLGKFVLQCEPDEPSVMCELGCVVAVRILPVHFLFAGLLSRFFSNFAGSGVESRPVLLKMIQSLLTTRLRMLLQSFDRVR